MSTPEQMPFTPSASIHVSQPQDRLLDGLCALTWLNVNTCWAAVTGAALHWDSVLHTQTPEHFVRRQVDVMPWVARQFVEYARGWMDIASETTGPRDATHNHEVPHEPEARAVPAGVSACATDVDAMMPEAVPLQAQADDESVAEVQVQEMTRAILARAAKAGR